MNLKLFLEKKTTKCLSELGIDSLALVKQSSRPEHGQYQANGVMGAAKKNRTKPAPTSIRLSVFTSEKK